MGDYRKLYAYEKAFDLAMEIFNITKTFPPEEKYDLTDQLRRSSRSVCRNIAEAYRRRRYGNYFTLRLVDSQAENSETQVSLDFAIACKFLTDEKYRDLTNKNNEVASLLNYMVCNPKKFM